jgi:hypothetical protein
VTTDAPRCLCGHGEWCEFCSSFPERILAAREQQQATIREAEKFRVLKAAWDGPGGESFWLEFCQDFDWEAK